MSNQILLIRPNIIEGESLAGYIFRLVTANHYSSVSTFSELLNESSFNIKSNSLSIEGLDKLSILTGKDKNSLKNMSVNFFQQFFERQQIVKLIHKSTVKYCPLCIQRQRVHQKIWMLRPVSVCILHNSLLIEHCPSCSRGISLDSLMSGRCKFCNCILSQCAPTLFTTNSMIIKSQQQIMNFFCAINPGENFLQGISIDKYLFLVEKSAHLLNGLPSFVDDAKLINAFSKNNKTVLDNAILYANAYWMYRDFPNNFAMVLQTFQKSELKWKYVIKSRFEQLFQVHASFRCIEEQYHKYWIKQFDEGTIHKTFSVFKTDASLLEKTTTLSKESVKKLGVSQQKISQLIEERQIIAHKPTTKKTGRYALNKQSIYSIIERQSEYITLCEASQALGISKRLIHKLIKSNKISIEKRSKKLYVIKKQEVERLLLQYRGVYVSGTKRKIKMEQIYLNRAYQLSFVRLLTLIDQKELVALSEKEDGNFHNTFFEERQFNNCIRKLKNEKTCGH